MRLFRLNLISVIGFFCFPVIGFSAVPGTFVPYDTRFSDAVTFDFEVFVKKPACTVKLGPDFLDTTKAIYLGKIRNEQGEKGPLVPVQLKFVDCDGYSSITQIRYIQDNKKPDSNSVNNGYITTTLDHVRVQLYTDSSGTAPFPSTGWQGKKLIVDKESEVITPCYAQTQVLQSNQKASQFEASASFEVTFQ